MLLYTDLRQHFLQGMYFFNDNSWTAQSCTVKCFTRFDSLDFRISITSLAYDFMSTEFDFETKWLLYDSFGSGRSRLATKTYAKNMFSSNCESRKIPFQGKAQTDLRRRVALSTSIQFALDRWIRKTRAGWLNDDVSLQRVNFPC